MTMNAAETRTISGCPSGCVAAPDSDNSRTDRGDFSEGPGGASVANRPVVGLKEGAALAQPKGLVDDPLTKQALADVIGRGNECPKGMAGRFAIHARESTAPLVSLISCPGSRLPEYLGMTPGHATQHQHVGATGTRTKHQPKTERPIWT